MQHTLIDTLQTRRSWQRMLDHQHRGARNPELAKLKERSVDHPRLAVSCYEDEAWDCYVELDAWNGSDYSPAFFVVPGILDQHAVAALTESYCWMLAIELQRCTGWPLMTFSFGSEDQYKSRDDAIDSWQHVAVVSQNRVIDAHGVQTFDQAQRRWSGSVPVAMTHRVAAETIMIHARSFDPVPPGVRRHNWSLTRSFARTLLLGLHRSGQLALPASWPSELAEATGHAQTGAFAAPALRAA